MNEIFKNWRPIVDFGDGPEDVFNDEIGRPFVVRKGRSIVVGYCGFGRWSDGFRAGFGTSAKQST